MISAIAAVDNNWQLGLNGGLPWPKHKADMEWFREITAGKVLVAGFKTYQTIKHLDETLGRKVLRIDEMPFDDWLAHSDFIVVGGRNAYQTFGLIIDQLYLSRIDYNGPADCHFPIDAFTPEQIQNAIWRKG